MQTWMRRLLVWALLAGLGIAYSQLAAEIRSPTILHTNDIHARLTPLENRRQPRP